MHILEDPSELSARARDFLHRSGRRQRPSRFEVPIELWRARDRHGVLVPAPMDLVVRCEGFERRFGGLRYEVRRSLVVDGERWERAYGWEYDHMGVDTRAWQDPGGEGWYFEWIGERVSKPCRDLLHTDGSVGTDVDGGSPYLRVAPSIPHLIESHALTDGVATWRPWPMGGAVARAVELLDGLREVPEASWDSSRWRLSETIAVRDYDSWHRERPSRHVCVWSRDETGHRQVRDALDSSSVPSAGR
ncbi:hypothetical protein SGFS_077670 [Streptomyces graminofaciens]|uniref:Uncharacterized protein n=1 Tax=Streptomyces graminofaciens TaxID=68212 RepID=A0ABM7FJQ3_9ACTN|nr:hypothetical protein [Streptomyces graminofaciens]BBC36473.1 hypothetical protein SGFS_077670 [Streptomyces graminofaciens]